MVKRWIVSRGTEIIHVFTTRQAGIKYIKELLTQSLEDLKEQDNLKTPYDYNVDFPRLQLYRINTRETYLGL